MGERAYIGTFHYLSAKHLHRYVGEVAGRHSLRPLPTIDQMGILAGGMIGRRRRYIDLTA